MRARLAVGHGPGSGQGPAGDSGLGGGARAAAAPGHVCAPLCGSSRPGCCGHSPPPWSSHPRPREQPCRQDALCWCPAFPPAAAGLPPPHPRAARGIGSEVAPDQAAEPTSNQLGVCRAMGSLAGGCHPRPRLGFLRGSRPAWAVLWKRGLDGRGALRSGPACRVQASVGQWLESVEPCVELPAHCPRLSPATQMWFLGTQAWCDLASGSENCLTWDRRSLRAVSITRALRGGCTRARFSGEPPTPGGELRGLGLADAWCALGESSCGWGGGGWPGAPATPRCGQGQDCSCGCASHSGTFELGLRPGLARSRRSEIGDGADAQMAPSV